MSLLDSLAGLMVRRDTTPAVIDAEATRSEHALHPGPFGADPDWAVANQNDHDARAAELGHILFPAFERQMGRARPGSLDDYQRRYTGENPDVWFYASISAISQDVAAVPVITIDARTGEPLRDAMPGPILEQLGMDALPELTEEVLIDLLTTANSFDVIDPGSLELLRWDPTKIRIYPDLMGRAGSYGLIDANGTEVTRLDAQLVVHSKLPNPRNGLWGTGPSQALRHTMIISEGEETYLLNFYADGARPGGFISFDKDINEKVARRAFEDFKQKHGGSRNHGKIAGLQGATWEQISTSPMENGYVEVRKITVSEVLAAFGVPPFRLFLLEDADYANAKKQEEMYDLKTVLPYAERRVRALNRNRLLVPDPTRIRLAVDRSFIEARHRDEEAITRANVAAVNGGLKTRTEARLDGWGRGELDPSLDVPDIGPMPLRLGPSPFAPPAPPPAPEPDDEDDEEEGEEERAVRQAARLGFDAEQIRLGLVWGPGIGVVRNLLGESGPARDRYELDVALRRAKAGASLEVRVEEVLAAMGRSILAIVEDAQRSASSRTIPDDLRAALEAWDFSEWSARMDESWTPEVIRIMAAEGRIKIEQTGLPADLFDVEDPNVIQWAQWNAANMVANVEAGTRDALSRQVVEALKNGESIDQLQKRLERSLGPDATPGRARRIALTESTAASGFGAQAAFEQAATEGVATQKGWLTVGDANVRETHAAAEQVSPIPLDGIFPNGLRYPGDPAGEAGERINDRCDLFPVVEGTE